MRTCSLQLSVLAGISENQNPKCMKQTDTMLMMITMPMIDAC
jgi:hypothetical protein